MTIRNIMLLTSCVMLLAGCSEDPASSSQADMSADSRAAWLLVSEPASALSVDEAKASAKEGDRIVLRGRIGGRKEPMSAESAVLTMMDTSIPHCGDNPDDKCSTPWDYCCVPKDQIAAHSATVQIVGPDGASAGTNPKAAGLSELDVIVVEGVVGPRPSEQVLTIRASGVYRLPE